MRKTGIVVLAATVIVLSAVPLAARDAGRIYGIITTVDGDRFEGLIRWDKNEASWVDILNGNKELSRENKRDARQYGSRRERNRRVKILGVTVFDDGDSWNIFSSAQSGLRFGHIKTLEAIDDDAVRLTLKSGQEVELSGGSTDIGTGIRELVIEDVDEGTIEFEWDDIDYIEFHATNEDARTRFGDRLYGTLETRRGDTFTGFVTWDVDELLTSDILDGEERGRDREISFGKIKSIERYSSRAAQVNLTSGDEIVLSGTNDVDDDNRGIVIADPMFGQVTVKWDEFERLDFSPPEVTVSYDDFDGGHPLSGVVYTDNGDSYRGRIRWDNDEEYSWELLDGEYRDVEFDIEFGAIKSIERRSHRSANVELWDGRRFRLSGSNDVDDDNKGIFVITDNGDKVMVEWDELNRVEFDKP